MYDTYLRTYNNTTTYFKYTYLSFFHKEMWYLAWQNLGKVVEWKRLHEKSGGLCDFSIHTHTITTVLFRYYYVPLLSMKV